MSIPSDGTNDSVPFGIADFEAVIERFEVAFGVRVVGGDSVVWNGSRDEVAG